MPDNNKPERQVDTENLTGREGPMTPDQAARKREKDSLLLSRNSVVQQIQATRNSRHKQMLEAALADLDAKLSQI